MPPNITQKEFTDFLTQQGKISRLIFVRKGTPSMTVVLKATTLPFCEKIAVYLRRTPLPGT